MAQYVILSDVLLIIASNGHAECLKVLLENSEDKHAMDVRDVENRSV